MADKKPLALYSGTREELRAGDTIAKADVGLGNVDNTSDVNKPISTATQTALDLKAPLASPAFTGTVTMPAVSGDVAFDTDTLLVDSANDRVGIGTSSPDYELQVEGDAVTVIAATSTAGGTSSLYLGDVTTPNAGRINYDGGGDSMRFATAEVERARIDSSGNVGIGTSSPQSNLHVRAGSGVDTTFRLSTSTTGDTSSDGFAVVQQITTNNVFLDQKENAAIVIKTNDTERARIDSSGNVGIGTSSPSGTGVARFLEIEDAVSAGVILDAVKAYSIYSSSSSTLVFRDQDAAETRMVIDASGNLLVGKPSSDSGATSGHEFSQSGLLTVTRDGSQCATFNRLTSDGGMVLFQQDGTQEGSISVSGTTVSYNGAHLTRWSQLTTAGRPEILRGSVMANLDEMCVWPIEAQEAIYWTEADGLPEGVSVGDVKVPAVEEVLDEEGNVITPAQDEILWLAGEGLEEGISIGDLKTPAIEAGFEDNEQLNKTKVSDVEGDKNIAGVFQGWDNDDDATDDFYIAMTGDFIIRIGAGQTVERGDLLMSAGDGTAKAQDDDCVRSKTIAKVTSTTISETYPDGSYCVPCVLMAC